MKHLLILILTCFAMSQSNAQLRATAMTGDTAAINSTVSNISAEVLESPMMVTIQAVLFKNSGTAAGKVELQATVDGTNYFRVRGCAQTTVDTLVILNVATTQSMVWTVPQNKYVKYRIVTTGTGTMNVRTKGWILRRKYS